MTKNLTDFFLSLLIIILIAPFLFIVLFLYFIKKSNIKNYGFVSGLFLILYSFFRFLIEFTREPDAHLGLIYNFITMGQILSVLIFIFGIIIIIYNERKRSN